VQVNKPKTRAARRAATSQQILKAAEVEFGEHGLEGATVRGIAHRARVDPSLVLPYYGSKKDLFAIAAQLDHERCSTTSSSTASTWSTYG
jgi:AcrR family transcriptional regulator